VRDRVDFRVTLSLSPPLVAMLRDDLLKTRAAAYLDRLIALGDQEVKRTAGDPTFHKLAMFYRDRFGRLQALYDELRGDLVDAFRRLEDDGYLEIVTVGATHGFLPAIREREAARAQIQIACEHHHRHFGRWPRGIWLPECGYAEGTDTLLAEAGLRFFFIDAHGLACGRPRPPLGTVAPVFTPAGVAAFARDLESSRQVWSAEEGYPGDPAYRDFYRDVGFDRPLAEIGSFIHPDGIRLHTGFKYHRVTGKVDLGAKLPYDPEVAMARAAEHAEHFLHNRQAQVRWLEGRMDRQPIVVSPYDAELFGHWWFEGPAFLEALCRRAATQDEVRLGTPAEYLETLPTNAVSAPSPSSWGDGGFAGVWIDESNDWIYRHQHQAERRMVELARQFSGGASDLERRTLNQAARELLLLQASDWAFILKTGTAMGYAISRVKAHAARFRRLDQALTTGEHDESWLADVEGRDNIFPDVDYRIYGRP
jgi:1,4-alpha-glucan branching enzyme